MDEASHTVTAIDAVAWKPLGDIVVRTDSPMFMGARPMGGVLSLDGTQLYVSTGRGGSLSLIDLASKKQVRSIDGVGDRPWGIALSADGRTVYTANGTSRDLSMTDVASGNVVHRVALGGLPWGVALSR